MSRCRRLTEKELVENAGLFGGATECCFDQSSWNQKSQVNCEIGRACQFYPCSCIARCSKLAYTLHMTKLYFFFTVTLPALRTKLVRSSKLPILPML